MTVDDRSAHDIETQDLETIKRQQRAARIEAQKAFNWSIVVSGIRCTLAYVVLPFVAPFIGLAPGVGPVLGIVIASVALVANVVSIRRFWRAKHPWRKPITVLHVGVIAFLLVLMAYDIRELMSL